jgi:hypothetical protein
MPEIQPRRGYTACQLRYAWNQWLEEMRGKAVEMTLASLIALVTGLRIGSGDIVEGGVWGGLIGAVVGAIGGPLVLSILHFLVKFFAAPAAIWRQQEADAEKLRQRNESLKKIIYDERWLKLKRDLVLENLETKVGERSGVSPVVRLQRWRARLIELEGEFQSGNYSNALEVLIFKDIHLGAVARVMPELSVARRDITDRVAVLAEQANRHVDEIHLAIAREIEVD